MRNMLLTSALSGSLALYPLGIHAQDYDSWTLGREVLNSAANYTGVLTTAHTQVRKYITWEWNTSLDEAEQLARTEALLAEITESQQINTDPRVPTVPTLKTDVLDSYAVRFRYCKNMLLSYFDGTGFKHGLSPQQIIDAPVLRAQRAGRTFNRDQLGRVKTVDDPTVDDPTEGGVMMLQTNGDSTPILACMGTEYDGALPEGTVAYMTSAVRKLAPRDDLDPRTETRLNACPTGYTDGPKTLTEEQVVERLWRFDDSPDLQGFPNLLAAVIEIEGEWTVSDDKCYRAVNEPLSTAEPCSLGLTGGGKRGELNTPGTDYHDPAKPDIAPTYIWHEVGSPCLPPPPPKPAGCTWTGSEKAWDACANRRLQSRNRGGGGSGGQNRNDGSFDVDGDGQGDFDSISDARSEGYNDGQSVNSGCGACSGPSAGPTSGGSGDGGGGGKGGGCFLTTAIVEQRGEADDGPTLTTLRAFRDGYMAQHPDGPALVAEYYDVAPRIVAAIPTDDPAWHWIGTQVDMAVARIEADDLTGAFAVYTSMVQNLKADWLTPITAPARHSDINPDNKNRETVQ